MQRRTFRRAIFLALALSLIIRVGFLAFGDVLPVMWDARRYVAAGLGLISLVDHSVSQEVTSERQDRYRFKYYYDEYIQGEKIEWLSYTPHTLTQAREELFFSGPLYPFFISLIFYLAPLADFTFVRLLGILFDLGANLLLILVGIRLAGRLPALLAGLAYAVYFPFVLSSSMILLDTSTIFWTLLTLYFLIRAVENNSKWFLFWAGLISGLLVLNKPTAMLLAVPLVAGLFFYVRKKWPLVAFLKRMLWYVAPLAVIVSGWVTVTSAYYGQLAVRDPGYAASNLRQSTSIKFEGYDLDKVKDNFWTRSITENILANPVGYMGLLVKKFDRLWHRPFNDFKRSFILSYQGIEVMHLLLVVFGLAGLLLLSRLNFGLAAWMVFIIGYYTVIHLIFHSLSRYNLNAMPMVLLTAGYFVAFLWSSWRQDISKKSKQFAGAIILLILAWQLEPNWINTIFSTGISYGLVIFCLILKSTLLALGLFWLWRMLKYDSHPRGKLLMVLGSTVIISVTGWTMTLARDNWAEFECKLTSSQMKAGTRLYLKEIPDADEGGILAAVVDINTSSDPGTSFILSVGNQQWQLTWNSERLKKLFYIKPTYQYYAQLIPMVPNAFRQYVILPVADSLLRWQLNHNGYIDIQVFLDSEQQIEGSELSLWGNYPRTNERIYIPRMRFTNANATSIEKFVHENDPRISFPVKYLSDSAISYYIPFDGQDIAVGKDLSPAPGMQSGRYNMFLVCIKQDGSFLIY